MTALIKKNKPFFNWLIYLLFLPALWLVYELNIKETIRVQALRSDLEVRLGEIEKIGSAMEGLKSIDDSSIDYIGNDLNKTVELLQFITDRCKKFKAVLKSLPPYTEYDEEGLRFRNQSMVLQGDFKLLLQLLREVEMKKGIGRSVFVEFFVSQENQARQRVLILEMVIQTAIVLQDA